MGKERERLIVTAKAYANAPGVPTDVRGIITKLLYEVEHSVPVYEGR